MDNKLACGGRFVEQAKLCGKTHLRLTKFLCMVAAMLTLKTLLADQTATAFAAELAAIAQAPCTQQKVSFWLSAGSVPAGWLPVVLEWMRRRGMEPTADDLAGLCPRNVIVLPERKGKGAKPQATNKAKSHRSAATPQVGGAA
jgi:hypothetical protein